MLYKFLSERKICKCKSTKDNTKNTKNQKKNISHTIKNKRYD